MGDAALRGSRPSSSFIKRAATSTCRLVVWRQRNRCVLFVGGDEVDVVAGRNPLHI
jgi:hypothetical protein